MIDITLYYLQKAYYDGNDIFLCDGAARTNDKKRDFLKLKNFTLEAPNSWGCFSTPPPELPVPPPPGNRYGDGAIY